MIDSIVLAGQYLADSSSDSDGSFGLLLLLAGPVFWVLVYLKYRNTNKRHKHESETEAATHNMVATDHLVKRMTGLSNSKMAGANHRDVKGSRNKGLF